MVHRNDLGTVSEIMVGFDGVADGSGSASAKLASRLCAKAWQSAGGPLEPRRFSPLENSRGGRVTFSAGDWKITLNRDDRYPLGSCSLVRNAK